MTHTPAATSPHTPDGYLPAPLPSSHKAFAALAVRDYRIYLSSGLISNIGTAMQGVALDWFVLTRTHSGTAVGWTTGLQFAPVLLFGLWGGVLSDRYDRRVLLLTAQTLYAVQAAILSVAVLTGHAPLWLIYFLSFWLGCVFTVENPARLSFVTELVGSALIPNAAGLNILSLTMARLIGPAVAGLLIAAVGTGWVFVINTASFALVIAGLAVIRPSPRTMVRGSTPWKGAGTAGLRYVAGRPRLLAVLAVFGLVMTFGVNFPITLTLFAGQVYSVGSRGLGFMSTALGVGTIAGTLLAARKAAPRVSKVVVGAVLFGAAETAAALAPAYVVFLALLVPAGFGLMMLNTAVSGYVQSEVHEAVRGRVMAVYTVVAMGGTPIGGPVTGWICQHAGVRWGMAVGAVVSIAGTGLVALWLLGRLAARGTATAAERVPQPVPACVAVPAAASCGEYDV
ncbi:major facilitator superfamily MFS_1 [Catenulispora acidiphila DSM 44928]|uniref:Major facilitator superfamily MFS_1 n=1 Tax=Catenulispora acidiphila (strain DSM 44928 / JCM 14897 / NBRC 102108 / NRRL B-24433 / ID139908) TaxID=479433 RepID=C7Q0Z2_CATAD|nr:MFS transporter [Catenulispora acidiphila]ACU71667.1 major facilitator superfamily MFS_1 [Catenulispora acidiphila DSM 44928]